MKTIKNKKWSQRKLQKPKETKVKVQSNSLTNRILMMFKHRDMNRVNKKTLRINKSKRSNSQILNIRQL